MIVLSVTLVAVVGFGIPLGIAVRRLYRNETVLRLERAAASSAIQVPATLQDTRDPVELPQQRDGTHVALYAPDGRRVAGVGPARADPIVTTAVAGRASTGTFAGDMIAVSPLTSSERVYAVLRAAVPASSVEARVRRAWIAMAGIAGAALLLAAIVAWRQTRRMVRPVQELAEAADRLGAGDFSIRPRTTGIAELDTVGVALGRTAERLGRMVGRERTFSEDASHQLRSPLTGLRLRLETAMETPSLSRAEVLEGSLADVERLDATIAALLTLAREPNPDRTVLDVESLLHDVEEAWHGRLAAEGRRLHVRFLGPRARVEASGAAMRQVLDVLVSNAGEHGAGTVTVGAHDIAGGLAIDVADEGPGPVDSAEAIFARRPEAGGSRGIGLALARSLVEAEGGRLLLSSGGPGPTFRVLLANGPTQMDESENG